MEERTPRAAIIAPPGTPGAATIVIPSIIMNPSISENEDGMPFISITAYAQATILSVLPER